MISPSSKRRKRPTFAFHQQLETRTLLAVGSLGFTNWSSDGGSFSTQAVGNLADAFSNSSDSQQWSFWWNAPASWNPNTGSGDLTSNRIGQPINYRPLIRNPDSQVWTVDGDQDWTNRFPGNQLRISGASWHPGMAYPESLSTSRDRFAIAAFTATESGFYRLANSEVRVSESSLDGVELFVHVENEFRFSQIFTSESPALDNNNIGYVAKGDRIFFAIGGNTNFSGDTVIPKFEIESVLPRVAPLRTLSGLVTIIDISNDPTRAIQQSLDLVQNGQRLKFISNQSEITLNSIAPSSVHMVNLVNRNNVELDFSGLKLNLNDRSKGFLGLYNCQNIILRNAILDYTSSALPFTQGVISRVDSNRIQFELSEGFDLPVDPNNLAQSDFNVKDGSAFRYSIWAYSVHPDGSGRVIEGAAHHHHGRSENGIRMTKVAGSHSRYRLNLDSTTGLSIGDGIVVQLRKNVAGVGIYRGGDQISVINVTMFASPGGFVSTVGGNNVNVIDSHVKRGPGRWKSVNADAVHIQSSREGAWVENSSFDGLGDDITTFYSFPYVMTDHRVDGGDTRVRVKQVVTNSRNFRESSSDYQHRVLRDVSPHQLRIGDRFIVYNPRVGTNASGGNGWVTVKGWTTEPEFPNRLAEIVFEEEFGIGNGAIVGTNDSDVRDNWSLYNQSFAKNFVVKTSQFLNSKRHGLYTMSSRVQILDNLFSGLAGQSVAGQNEAGWPLGLFSRNVLVQGNQFEGNMLGRPAMDKEFHAGDVSFYATRFENTANDNLYLNQPWYHLRNLEIRDNNFYNWRKSAITVRNAFSVSVVGNTFLAPQKFQDQLSTDDSANYRSDDPNRTNANEAIRLSFSRKVTVSDNYSIDAGINGPEFNELAMRSPLYHVTELTSFNRSPQQSTLGDSIPNLGSEHLAAYFKFDRLRYGSRAIGIMDDSSPAPSANPLLLYEGNRQRNQNSLSDVIRKGRLEDSLYFDGIDDRVEIRSNSDINERAISKRTISFWVNVNDSARNSATPLILYDEGNSFRGMNVYIQAQKVFVGIWDNSVESFLEMPIGSGWQHIAFVLDAPDQILWQTDAFRGFVNGSQLAQGIGKALGIRNGNIGIGAAVGTTRTKAGTIPLQNHFSGMLDELRIYDRALTRNELAALANRRHQSPWPFAVQQ